MFIAAPRARAVVVRGKVTSTTGTPLAGARVQLIQGPRSVGDAISGPDGSFEIRSPLAGRFLLLTTPSIVSAGYAPQIARTFYAGRTDSVRIDIALNQGTITPRVTAEQTLYPLPLQQLATSTTEIGADELLTRARIAPELRTVPGAILVQDGQVGSQATLLLRGAPPSTLLTTIDGVTANPLGGAFDLATLSASGFSALSPAPAAEVTPGASAVPPINASGGKVALHATEAASLHPTLTYTGDAGTLDALHHEAVGAVAYKRLDVRATFARLDTSNDLPASKFHLATYSANAGYHISAETSLRVVFRDDLSAGGLLSPYEFFHVTPTGRDAHQNIFAAGTFETRIGPAWPSTLRYGLVRSRQQIFDFSTPAAGLPVTITGANGFSASGTASFLPLPAREDTVTGRDSVDYQTDYRWKQWLNLSGEIGFESARASDHLPSEDQTLGRTHVSAALLLSGDFKHRVFYQATGSFDHQTYYGLTGNPRLGLTYVPVPPGTRRFHGTILHASAATGSRETSLLEEASAPQSLALPRSRTFDASLEQTILAQKLSLRATYFHSQFSHEFEPLSVDPLTARENLSQTLALRTQGFESELRYQPFRRVLLGGGYSFLAALTEQSATPPVVSPNAPGIAIGALSALAGARPFHRPPHSGFLHAEYSGSKLNLALKGSFSSRSDDSTYLFQTPALLLPNRDLSPAYASLDASVSYAFRRHVTIISQLDNLTDNRHLAPIGFLATPFSARAGLRIRLGAE